MNVRALAAHSPVADALSLAEAMRPRQWTKNLIVFAPAFFQFKPKLDTAWPCLVFTALFCLVSSAFYLLNDVADRETDRLHPRKRFRPIASGRVNPIHACGLAALLLATAITVGWWTSIPAALMMVLYCLLQVLYNLWAKHVALLDLLFIASGFVVRAGSGAAAGHIPLSPWFLLCVGLLAVFLGIEKRKAEMAHAGDGAAGSSTRQVLQDYTQRLLDRMEQVVVSGGVVTYALWSAGPHLNGASTPAMMLTLPAVLYGVFRYQWLSEHSHGDTERPEDLLLTDRPLLWTAFCWVITTSLVLAGHAAGFLE